MATTAQIIDAMILANGDEVADPIAFTRVQLLALCNQLYQYQIGPLLETLATYSYDASGGASDSIAVGIGTLPSDFLGMAQVYDGDAPTDYPLKQIFNIEDRVISTVAPCQYMLPDNSHIWIFGATPVSTIKLYYYKMPAVLTDSTGIPSELNSRFHIGVEGIFEAAVKLEYAKRINNTYDMFDFVNVYTDLMNEISKTHGIIGKRDNSPMMIKQEW